MPELRRRGLARGTADGCGVTDQPLEAVTATAASPPATIPMPDHEVRQARWYQVYVRLARPTLDWATLAWFCWVTMGEPLFRRSFDIAACGMSLAWCGTVYGIKTFEKTRGVA